MAAAIVTAVYFVWDLLSPNWVALAITDNQVLFRCVFWTRHIGRDSIRGLVVRGRVADELRVASTTDKKILATTRVCVGGSSPMAAIFGVGKLRRTTGFSLVLVKCPRTALMALIAAAGPLPDELGSPRSLDGKPS